MTKQTDFWNNHLEKINRTENILQQTREKIRKNLAGLTGTTQAEADDFSLEMEVLRLPVIFQK